VFQASWTILGIARAIPDRLDTSQRRCNIAFRFLPRPVSQLEGVIKTTGLLRSVIKKNRNGERAVCPETRSGPRVLSHDFDSQTCRRCGSREDWLDVLNSISIAERLSWAAKRETTRPEDKAYCLLGLFGVNMPLLYGEGSSAFPRLLEEVLKTSDDQSVFAFARSVFLSHHYPFDGLARIREL